MSVSGLSKFETARSNLIKWESAHRGQGIEKHNDPEYKRLYAEFKQADSALSGEKLDKYA